MAELVGSACCWQEADFDGLLSAFLADDLLPHPASLVGFGSLAAMVWRLLEVEAKAGMTTSADVVPFLEASFTYLSSHCTGGCKLPSSMVDPFVIWP